MTSIEYLAQVMIRMIPQNVIVYEQDTLEHIERAKEIYKQEILSAVAVGQNNNSVSISHNRLIAEEYYQEIIKTK